MRALVIGGSGQVGGALLAALAAAGHAATGTWRSAEFPGGVHCDLRDPDELSRVVRAAAPDAVFCPAGATWVDGCESDPAGARAANVAGPLAALRAAPGVPFVYFSTEYVFDGHGGPYGEDALPRPLQVYGRTKLEGERAVLDASARALVVRTGGVFGPERQGKNFVYQCWRRLRAGERLRVPGDQWGTPTFAPDLAAACLALVAGGHAGVVHVAGPQCCTRLDFARRICAALGLDGGLLQGATTAELAPPAPRPLRGGLRCARLPTLGIAAPRPIDDGLAAMRGVLGAA